MAIRYPAGVSKQVLLMEAQNGSSDMWVFDFHNKFPTYTKCYPYPGDIQAFFGEVSYTAWCEQGSNGEEVYIEITISTSQACILEGYDINGNIKYSEEFNKSKIIKIPSRQGIANVRIMNKARSLYSHCIDLNNVCDLTSHSCLEYAIICDSFCGKNPSIIILKHNGPYYFRVTSNNIISEWGGQGAENPYGQWSIPSSENCLTKGIKQIFDYQIGSVGGNVPNDFAKFCILPYYTKVSLILPGFKPVEIDLASARTKCLTQGGIGLPGGGGQP